MYIIYGDDYMINWTDLKKLQSDKLNYQLKLNDLLKSPNVNIESINELKSEIIHINKQIEKIVGKKELERQDELKVKKIDTSLIDLNNYNILKNKYDKISNINNSTKKIIEIIKIYKNLDNDDVKVKVA